MMFGYLVLGDIAPVGVPVKLVIRPGFLKDNITGVFLVVKNTGNYRRTPFAAAPGWNVLLVHHLGNTVGAGAFQSLIKHHSHQCCLLLHNHQIAVFVLIAVWR